MQKFKIRSTISVSIPIDYKDTIGSRTVMYIKCTSWLSVNVMEYVIPGKKCYADFVS